MNSNVLILRHGNCSDGAGAAYAAWKKFGDSAEYVEVHYGNPPPDVTGREVYILDFSYKPVSYTHLTLPTTPYV